MPSTLSWLCLSTMTQSTPAASAARASFGLSPTYTVSSFGTSKDYIPFRIGSGNGLCLSVSSKPTTVSG